MDCVNFTCRDCKEFKDTGGELCLCYLGLPTQEDDSISLAPQMMPSSVRRDQKICRCFKRTE